MLATIIPTREVCKTLRTGALTSYVNYDDAWYANLGLGVAKEYLILSVEAQYTGTTAIVVNGKTDNHSNICVLDLKTGLMWSQTVSASVGPGSNGKLPWTTTGSGATAEGIFPYCAAANAAGLAGFTDWRVPNRKELSDLLDLELSPCTPNTTACPGWPVDKIWTSSTVKAATTYAWTIYRTDYYGEVRSRDKTNLNYTALVRGGNL